MDKLIDQLRIHLEAYPDLKLAILFGSLARGDGRADSDLDLAILAEHPLSAQRLKSMIGALADQFGRPVDLIDISTAGEPLLGQILAGKRILGSNAAFAALLSRHLIDAADFLPLRERMLAERRARWTG